MNRRGFLGMVAALPAVPVALKAAEAKDVAPVVGGKITSVPVYHIYARGATENLIKSLPGILEASARKTLEEARAVMSTAHVYDQRNDDWPSSGWREYDVVEFLDGRTVWVPRPGRTLNTNSNLDTVQE